MARAPIHASRFSHRRLAAPAGDGIECSRPVRRAFARRARALIGAAACGLVLNSACGDDSPPPVIEPDAGPVCELGTRNCACIGGSRCSADLLCIAGLCSARIEPPPEEDEPPVRPRPTPPDPGDPAPDAGGVSAPADGGTLDASVPDASAEPIPDASADAG